MVATRNWFLIVAWSVGITLVAFILWGANAAAYNIWAASFAGPFRKHHRDVGERYALGVVVATLALIALCCLTVGMGQKSRGRAESRDRLP